jgi:aldehyde:ferredoxin oxidoreductase
LFVGVTGRQDIKSGKDLIRVSESVYNFQRVFNLRVGFGTREHDAIPYRSMGPVTAEEYESRAERYDKQLKELVCFDPEGKTTEEKMAVLRRYREDRYEKLIDAVYLRRGWNENGIPTLETLKRLRIDFPEVVEVVKEHL